MSIKPLLGISLLTLIISPGCKKDTNPAESPTGSLRDVHFWAYQIDNLDDPASIDSICASHYDLVVMDQQRSISGSENYNTQQDIQKIHNSLNSKGGSKLVVCYIDIGQAESYRYYWKNEWQQGNPSWILEPDPDGWNDSFGAKYWSPEWKAIMKQYVGRIIADGFDGIYLDWLLIYETPGITLAAQQDGVDPVEELISFISELRAYATNQKSGFLFIAQNAAELAEYPEYVSSFDAIAQEDIWFDGTGDPDNGGNQGDAVVDLSDTQYYLEKLNRWQQLGKPVFNVEYAELPENVSRAYSSGSQHHFVTYTTLRLLDQLTRTPPPGY